MKDPAFLFYSKDWIEGTAEMLPDEKGVFIDLLSHQHQKGDLPSDTTRLARLVGLSKDEFLPIWETLKHKFKQATDDRLVNHRLTVVVGERKDRAVKNRVVGVFGSLCRQTDLTKKQLAEIKKLFKPDDFITISTDDLTNRLSEWFTMSLASLEDGNGNEDVNATINTKRERGAGEREQTAIRILEYYSTATCRKIDARNKKNLSYPLARLREGFTEDDLKEIADYKAAEWKGTDYEKHLEVPTLYGSKHCNKYRDQVINAKEKGLTIDQIRGTKKGINEGLSQRVAALYRQPS